MGYPARDLFDERGEDETVLVQGIIDGYYETDDGIVLMDYKTDSLKPGDEKKCLYRVIGDRWSYTGMHWKK